MREIVVAAALDTQICAVIETKLGATRNVCWIQLETRQYCNNTHCTKLETVITQMNRDYNLLMFRIWLVKPSRHLNLYCQCLCPDSLNLCCHYHFQLCNINCIAIMDTTCTILAYLLSQYWNTIFRIYFKYIYLVEVIVFTIPTYTYILHNLRQYRNRV